MALAGEDDDDDEDEAPRRGSSSKAPGAAPTKSLKGKETFKARQPSREELNRALAKAKDSRRSKSHKRRSRRRGEDGRGRGFIDGILSDEESSDDSSDRERVEDRRKRRREDMQGEETQPVRPSCIVHSRYQQLTVGSGRSAIRVEYAPGAGFTSSRSGTAWRVLRSRSNHPSTTFCAVPLAAKRVWLGAASIRLVAVQRPVEPGDTIQLSRRAFGSCGASPASSHWRDAVEPRDAHSIRRVSTPTEPSKTTADALGTAASPDGRPWYTRRR